jgi:lambda family phage tail tape measure protein
LTPRELEQIRNFQALGDKAGAIGVVLTALQRTLGGANERGITPLGKGVNDLTSALGRLEDRLSSGKVASFFGMVGGRMLERAGQMVDLATGSGPGTTPGAPNAPTAEDLAQSRQSLDVARRQLADLEARLPTVTGTLQASQLNAQIARAKANVADLQNNVAGLERQAYDSTTKTVGDNVRSSATALSNEIKEASAVTEKYATIVAERQKLQADRAQLQKVIDSPIADPQQAARAAEAITQIDGKLRALRTPADEARRALDLEGTLAKLPPHIQAAERAAEETRRRFLEMGESVVAADAAADKARANVLQTQATATGQQIQLLSDEAAAALKVADAYGTSRAAALRLQAQLKAQSAERQGSIAGGTAGTVAQQTLEETAGNAIAASAEKNEAYGREVVALGRLVEAEAKGSAAAREAERANKVATVAEDLRAQAAATNNATIVAAVEKQIAVYDALSKRELAANVRREANSLNAQYDPAVAYDLETKKLQELQATGLLTARTVEEYTRQSEQRRLEASRSATDGMIAGLRRYADEAMNAGAAAADGVKRGVQTMEDALVQFVTTGQISVGNLANSIIADFARVAIRQTVTGPLSSILGSVVGSLFGGGSNTGGFATVGSGAGVTNGVPNFFGMHDGGIVGRDASFRRAIDPRHFDNAPRYHRGGIPGLGPNERAIIALDEEEVLTRSDPRHRWNLGSGSGGSAMVAAPVVNLKLVNNGPPMDAQQGQTTPDGRGGWNVELILDAVDEGMAQRASAGRGKFMGVLAGSYGVRKQPRR